jgi:glycosyltransferase involved in cell wall biosynthesis
MTVSILLCTRNHATSLRETLQSLAQVAVPDQLPCELVVVDNGSTDATAEVVRSFTCSSLSVRYLGEPRPGKGHAYNAGMAAAQGRILLLTDDDVRLPRHWIAGMAAPILAGQAQVVAGGVRIAPHLERPGMQPAHRTLLASTEGLNAEAPQWIVGANMAFAKEVLAKVPAFDTELGPGALGFEDEVLFYRQLLKAGYRVATAFDVVVEHHFDEARLQRSSFLEIARKKGRSEAYVEYHWKHRTIGRPYWQLLKCYWRLARWRLRRWGTYRQEAIPQKEELDLVSDIHFHYQYLAERKRPRLYEPFGLVKGGLDWKRPEPPASSDQAVLE